jgi:spore maturation protein CgeB
VSGQLKIRYFAHSWVSDWNHGNAHFLRGLAQALRRLGHDVRCYEALGSWSLSNLVKREKEKAVASIDQFRERYPGLDVQFYNNDESFAAFAANELADADVVIVHEWNEPEVVNQILALKRRFGFRALFHDTHHRAYTNPREILRFNLYLFDGVLTFGEALRTIYSDAFGVPRAWTFHEAADVEEFRPLEAEKSIDVLWIGNWGDEERTRELQEFLIGPSAGLGGHAVVVHGVRYPADGLAKLAAAGIQYRGYLPNLECPRVYAQSRIALHVPRRQYANGLSGIPTIRVFEALACGTPLLCSPWTDVEGLFRPGEDYLVVPDGRAMQSEVLRLLRDEGARRQLARNGRETILKAHTCEHRAQQLIAICEELGR